MLIGVVGKPSVGKSTFFKACTLAEVEIASYPFTTIKPNRGVGYVRVKCADRDFDKQCNPSAGFCIDGIRFVPVELVDVAGLVPGAHEGKGMGNQFLSDLNQADLLIHIVDVSGTTNEKGEACQNYDPSFDVDFLEKEIDLWYLDVIKRGWDKITRLARQKSGGNDASASTQISKALAEQLSSFKVTNAIAKNAIYASGLKEENFDRWNEDELKKLAAELRKRTKPMIIAANKMDLPKSKENVEMLKTKFPDYKIVPCSGDAEVALRMAAKAKLIKYMPGDRDFEIIAGGNDANASKHPLNEAQTAALEKIRSVLKEFGSTGVQHVLDSAVFDFLQYIAIFPGSSKGLTDSRGNVMPDCFLMPPESTALDFAFRLHTDFGKAFLYAIDVRKSQRIGKEHKLKNRDVIEIISAAK